MSPLTTVDRRVPRWRARVGYLRSADGVDAPAVAGRGPALSREEIPVGVALRAESANGVVAVLLRVLAGARVPGGHDGGVERDGSAQCQKGGGKRETDAEQPHGDDDDDEEAVEPVKTNVGCLNNYTFASGNQ